jgi:hypothetical protein
MGQFHTAPSLPVSTKGLNFVWSDSQSSLGTVYLSNRQQPDQVQTETLHCEKGSSWLLATESVLLKTFKGQHLQGQFRTMGSLQ